MERPSQPLASYRKFRPLAEHRKLLGCRRILLQNSIIPALQGRKQSVVVLGSHALDFVARGLQLLSSIASTAVIKWIAPRKECSANYSEEKMNFLTGAGWFLSLGAQATKA